MSRTIRKRVRNTDLFNRICIGDKPYLLNTDKWSGNWRVNSSALKWNANKIMRTHEKWIISNCLKSEEFEFDGMTHHTPSSYRGLIWAYD